jgi:hypothetical protein
MSHQQGDVTGSIPQWGKFYGEDDQTVEQIFPKGPLSHHGSQVSVGGRDQSDIHRDFSVASDPANLPLFENTQEGDLGIEAQFADFIKEDGPLVCLFEEADARLVGVGE